MLKSRKGRNQISGCLGIEGYVFVFVFSFLFFLLFFSFIFISWRLITLQYCSGFCHTLTWRDIVFPVVMYRCEKWTVKKAESWRIDAFELWCWRRLLRVPWWESSRKTSTSALLTTPKPLTVWITTAENS